MDKRLAFQKLEYDFLQYMLQYGGLGRKTSLDYVSRMRFLSNNYLLDENITDECIDNIMSEERN